MILTDKDILALVSENKLIVEGFKKEHLKGIAYELTIAGVVCSDGKLAASYDIKPGEIVYIKSNEKISVPKNLVGKIIERNSLMRQGLKVDGPCYIPGHETFCFLRVQNLTQSNFTLTKDFAVAQIMFEQLSGEPEQTYDKQNNASFRDETDYRGLSRYAGEYEKLTKRLESAKEDLDSIKEKIYTNVLTLMGVIVAVFSLLTVDIKLISEKTDIKSIVTANLSLAVSISVLMGIILIFLNKAKNKLFLGAYIIILVTLVALMLLTTLF